MEDKLFTKKQLYALIIPLVIEQILAVLVGMADTIMVSQVGEAAVSGVSLVDSINYLLINIFGALATGGAVVCARYVGQRDYDRACESANQLMLVMVIISTALMAVALLLNQWLLQTIFGKVDEAVMQNAKLYFYLTALSFPGLAVYNAGAALCRAMGNSKISMKVSLLMNAINIGGNAIFIYGFHMGVEGVAIPTLVSRLVVGVVMLFVVLDTKQPLHLDVAKGFRPNRKRIREILKIGIPNGMEGSLFQLGKILVQSLIASFGTAAIAANAVANALAGLQIIPGAAIGLAMITVVGQSVGARRYDEARGYIKQLMKMACLSMGAICMVTVFLLNPLISWYHLSPEAFRIAKELMLFHSVTCMLFWALAFTLPNALRASGDVMYTMWVSLGSMWVCRIIFSYVLGDWLGLGVLGVWIAMVLDWIVRLIFFIVRLRGDRWLKN